MSPIYAHQIFSDSDWYFSLICYPVHTDSQSDFISRILMYPFFNYIHKENNATVTDLLKFMGIFLKIHVLLTSLRHVLTSELLNYTKL